MTGTNHLLAGALIATASKNPYIALPAAFASHFVLDSLPHFGFKRFVDQNRQLLLKVAGTDLFCVLVLSVLLLARFPVWYLLAGYIAMSPDIAWVYRFGNEQRLRHKSPKKMNFFNTFHKNIQHYERVWGIFVELPFAVMLSMLLFTNR